MTANVNWNEIQDNLRPGEKAHERTDLIARVFYMKMDAMLDDIESGDVFGQICAVVEFQKRGLPHCHFLLWLQNPVSIDTVDNYITAEIPNKDSQLYKAVTAFMIHKCSKERCLKKTGFCRFSQAFCSKITSA